MNIKIIANLFCLMAFAVASTEAFAASNDDYSVVSNKSVAYHDAVKLIKIHDYDAALAKLKMAEKLADKDADIQNLLGFASRKSGRLEDAARYYQKALQLDPKHKGALEYQGELFLMLGDKVAAEKNLQKLDKICWLGCGELDDLRAAIRNYKP